MTEATTTLTRAGLYKMDTTRLFFCATLATACIKLFCGVSIIAIW
jgi:hypothetical protein